MDYGKIYQNNKEVNLVANSVVSENIHIPIENLFKYSTDEIPIGIWHNGKVIYRKVVLISSYPGGSVERQYNVSSSMDECINIYGIGKHTENSYHIPLNFHNKDIPENYSSICYIRQSTGQVSLKTTWPFNGYVVVEYTKK